MYNLHEIKPRRHGYGLHVTGRPSTRESDEWSNACWAHGDLDAPDEIPAGSCLQTYPPEGKMVAWVRVSSVERGAPEFKWIDCPVYPGLRMRVPFELDEKTFKW